MMSGRMYGMVPIVFWKNTNIILTKNSKELKTIIIARVFSFSFNLHKRNPITTTTGTTIRKYIKLIVETTMILDSS